jgi:ribosomal protein S9
MTTMASATVREQSRRKLAIARAIHNGEMENLTVNERTRKDMNEYALGRISVTELIQRGRAQFGLK